MLFSTEGIKYIGSKRTLVDYILNIVQDIGDVETILDGFSGTTRVGQMFRNNDYVVYTNDVSEYSYAFGKCYIEASKSDFSLKELDSILNKLNNVEPVDGGILTTYYSGGSTSYKKNEKIKNEIMFWQRKNTMKADAIRNIIEDYRDNENLYYTLITSLILALDKVDNTVGVQQAFLKNSWSKRSYNDLNLVAPMTLLNFTKGKAYKSDINDLVRNIKMDLAYYDPPYTSHNYSSYYHIWDTLVKNKIDKTSGITNRSAEVNKSDYNYKNKALNTFTDLLKNTNSKYILISYNNEGIISYEDLISMSESIGKVSVTEVDYKRNIMSQIGIYNSKGELAGTPGKNKNIEYLILIKK